LIDLGQERYKCFPPGWSHLHLPMSTRRGALAGLATYSACSSRALLAQRAAWLGVWLFGPRVLPGRAVRWIPAVPADVWSTMVDTWSRRFGPLDAIAGYERLQLTRPGLALVLLRRGTPVAFVKLRDGAAPAWRREAEAMQMVWDAAPRSFVVTEPLGHGEVGDWSYIAAAPMPPSLHTPPESPPLGIITGDIARALSALTRPADTPSHWTPVHGDFTPWNLRRLGHSLYLIDWENVGWGPPGTDEVLYQATTYAIGGKAVKPTPYAEAVAHWRDVIQARVASNDRDQTMRSRMLAALAALAG